MFTRDFGSGVAGEITDIVMRYYQINIARRPEFMAKTTFNYVNYGDEGQKRLDDLTALLTRATAVSDSFPANKKDAFYEMVLYPASLQPAAEPEVHRGGQGRPLCAAGPNGVGDEVPDPGHDRLQHHHAAI